jgi:hypothetical protein
MNLKNFVDQMRRTQAPAMVASRDLFVVPLRSRYAGNTGAGEDGRIQKYNPVAVMDTANGPRMLHEGEDVYQRPDGRVDIKPVEESLRTMPQHMLRRMEKKGMPGYVEGATRVDMLDPYIGTTSSGSRTTSSGSGTTSSGSGTTSSGSTFKPLYSPTDMYRQRLQLPVTSNSKDYATGSGLTGSGDANGTVGGASDLLFGGGLVSNRAVGDGSTISAPAQNVPVFKSTLPTREGLSYNLIAPSPAPVAPVAPVPEMQKEEVRTAPTPATFDYTVPAATTETTSTTPTEKTPYDYYLQGLGALGRYAEGGSPAMQAAQAKYLQDLKATQGVSQRVAGFEAAQAGVDKERAAARQAIGRAAANAELGEAESKMAANEMQQREQAAKDLALVGMTGAELEEVKRQALAKEGLLREEFDETKRKTQVSEGWTTIQNLLAADPYMGANTIAGIQAAAGKLGVQFDANALARTGKQTQFVDGMKLVSNMIASNASASEIKNALAANGLADAMNTAYPGGSIDTLLGSMSKNPIDVAMAQVTGSFTFQKLRQTNPEMADKIETLMWAGIVAPGVVSVDKDGNFTINPNASDTTNVTVGAPNATSRPATDTPTLAKPGDIYIEDSVAYKVGDDRSSTSFSIDTGSPESLWSNDATKILEKGRTGNETMYDAITEARVDYIKTNPTKIDLEKIVTLPQSSPVFKAALQYAPIGNFHIDNAGTALRDPPTPGTLVKIKLPDGSYSFTKVISTDGSIAKLQGLDGKSYEIHVWGGRASPGGDVVRITDMSTSAAKTYRQNDWR